MRCCGRRAGRQGLVRRRAGHPAVPCQINRWHKRCLLPLAVHPGHQRQSRPAAAHTSRSLATWAHKTQASSSQRQAPALTKCTPCELLCVDDLGSALSSSPCTWADHLLPHAPTYTRRPRTGAWCSCCPSRAMSLQAPQTRSARWAACALRCIHPAGPPACSPPCA